MSVSVRSLTGYNAEQVHRQGHTSKSSVGGGCGVGWCERVRKKARSVGVDVTTPPPPPLRGTLLTSSPGE
jgi:hypothetical protein